MRFNPKADISRGRVSGSRGGGGGGRSGGLGGLGGALGGGGRGLPIPGGLGLKGTIVVVILYVVLQMCTGGGLPGPSLGAGGSDGAPQSSGNGNDPYEECKLGEQANKDVNCARKAVVLSLEQFWEQQASEAGFRFQPAPVQTFTGNVSTACGAASSGMGPFYCPADMGIYEDTSFYPQVFEGVLKGKPHEFVEPYVLAHEYGHHISNLTLTDGGSYRNDLAKGAGEGAGSGAVNVELQADCYAGLWAGHAEKVPNDDGVIIIEDLSDADIDAALMAAATVGDDHIQKVTRGRVDEAEWTHGSSEQRMKAFRLGYEGGRFSSCSWNTVKSEVNS